MPLAPPGEKVLDEEMPELLNPPMDPEGEGDDFMSMLEHVCDLSTDISLEPIPNPPFDNSDGRGYASRNDIPLLDEVAESEAEALASLFRRMDFKHIEVKMDFHRIHHALEMAMSLSWAREGRLPHPDWAPDSGCLIGKGVGMQGPMGYKISFSGPGAGTEHWVNDNCGVLVVDGHIRSKRCRGMLGFETTKMRRIFLTRTRMPSWGIWTKYVPRAKGKRLRRTRNLFYCKTVAFYIYKDRFFRRDVLGGLPVWD